MRSNAQQPVNGAGRDRDLLRERKRETCSNRLWQGLAWPEVGFIANRFQALSLLLLHIHRALN